MLVVDDVVPVVLDVEPVELVATTVLEVDVAGPVLLEEVVVVVSRTPENAEVRIRAKAAAAATVAARAVDFLVFMAAARQCGVLNQRF